MFYLFGQITFRVGKEGESRLKRAAAPAPSPATLQCAITGRGQSGVGGVKVAIAAGEVEGHVKRELVLTNEEDAAICLAAWSLHEFVARKPEHFITAVGVADFYKVRWRGY